MATNLADIQRIQQHLETDRADAENVLSDIKELSERDPTLFTGVLGEDARLYLDDAEQQIAAGDKNEVFALYKTLQLLEEKLREVGGKRRRRKSRKVRTRSARPSGRRGRKSRRRSRFKLDDSLKL